MPILTWPTADFATKDSWWLLVGPCDLVLIYILKTFCLKNNKKKHGMIYLLWEWDTDGINNDAGEVDDFVEEQHLEM